MRELDAAFAAFREDAGVRGVIVTGAGAKAFVAGADIGELGTQTALQGRDIARKGQGIFDRIENLGKPVIAAVNGFALGGGCELALACHVRVASENAKIGTPEVKLGLICGYGGTQRLPRLVGRGRALEILLTGDPVDAAEAYRIGLVNKVVPQDKLLEESEALLRKMLGNGPVALRYTLDAVNAGLGMTLADGQDHEATLFSVLCATDDKREGTQAFLEKRKAAFSGK
jgi:enoyl-CoA hydratase